MIWVGAIVALIGALAHVYFAYCETLGWGRPFVEKVAPSWISPADSHVDKHIDWAQPLAFNIGSYNLVLALGLAWTCWAFLQRPAMAGALAIFFAIWLLLAAAAAFYTKVMKAFFVQGILGVALLILGCIAS
jgi:uncharacterized membrane protein